MQHITNCLSYIPVDWFLNTWTPLFCSNMEPSLEEALRIRLDEYLPYLPYDLGLVKAWMFENGSPLKFDHYSVRSLGRPSLKHHLFLCLTASGDITITDRVRSRTKPLFYVKHDTSLAIQNTIIAIVKSHFNQNPNDMDKVDDSNRENRYS